MSVRNVRMLSLYISLCISLNMWMCMSIHIYLIPKSDLPSTILRNKSTASIIHATPLISPPQKNKTACIVHAVAPMHCVL